MHNGREFMQETVGVVRCKKLAAANNLIIIKAKDKSTLKVLSKRKCTVSYCLATIR